jgi:hypothetical protein
MRAQMHLVGNEMNWNILFSYYLHTIWYVSEGPRTDRAQRLPTQTFSLMKHVGRKADVVIIWLLRSVLWDYIGRLYSFTITYSKYIPAYLIPISMYRYWYHCICCLMEVWNIEQKTSKPESIFHRILEWKYWGRIYVRFSWHWLMCGMIIRIRVKNAGDEFLYFPLVSSPKRKQRKLLRIRRRKQIQV